MAQFNPGDVVMLRSGGPYMTVSAVATGDNLNAAAGDLVCRWFDGPNLYSDTFNPSSVKAVQEPVAVPNDPDE